VDLAIRLKQGGYGDPLEATRIWRSARSDADLAIRSKRLRNGRSARSNADMTIRSKPDEVRE